MDEWEHLPVRRVSEHPGSNQGSKNKNAHMTRCPSFHVSPVMMSPLPSQGKGQGEGLFVTVTGTVKPLTLILSPSPRGEVDRINRFSRLA
jgi:hypothetical protein